MKFSQIFLKYRIFEFTGLFFVLLSILLYGFIKFSDNEINSLNNQSNTNEINTDEINHSNLQNNLNDLSIIGSQNDSNNNIVNQSEFNDYPYSKLPSNFKVYKKSILDFLDDNTPLSISIKEIGLNSDIKALEIIDLKDASSYETPKNIVGHIPQSYKPGEKGKSWYFGHLESFIKKEGNVFHMLPKIPGLMKTDPYLYIHIKTNSRTFVYHIYKTEVVPRDDLVLEIESDISEVILVTCVPSFLYHSRLLVHSKLIGTY